MSEIKSDTESSPITEPVRRRLPAYYRALIAMYGEGMEKVSSRQLSIVIGLTESQVRADMTAIGCIGRKGYGYNIARLYGRIGEVMRLRDRYSAAVVGSGALADAVSASQLFTKRGIKLISRFTESDAVSGNELFSRLSVFCRSETVDILILACDGRTAAECLALAENTGIKGVMNFSETDLHSERLTVRNIHIDDALMMLCSEI